MKTLQEIVKEEDWTPSEKVVKEIGLFAGLVRYFHEWGIGEAFDGSAEDEGRFITLFNELGLENAANEVVKYCLRGKVSNIPDVRSEEAEDRLIEVMDSALAEDKYIPALLLGEFRSQKAIPALRNFVNGGAYNARFGVLALFKIEGDNFISGEAVLDYLKNAGCYLDQKSVLYSLRRINNPLAKKILVDYAKFLSPNGGKAPYFDNENLRKIASGE